jgi:fatty acid-binding protein DegV
LAKPLFEATKGGELEPLARGGEQKKAFKEIKNALTNASALGLLDVMNSYIHK